MTTPKLTKPQADLLRAIAEKPRYVAPHYAPARRLVALGLAQWGYLTFSQRLHATAAGRALTTALTTAEETKLAQRGFTSDGGVREPI